MAGWEFCTSPTLIVEKRELVFGDCGLVIVIKGEWIGVLNDGSNGVGLTAVALILGNFVCLWSLA